MSDDPLATASWECAPAPPGRFADPAELTGSRDLAWLPVQVPGTAAAAVRASAGLEAALARDYDSEDWWFRCRFPGVVAAESSWSLDFEGLATACQVWLNGRQMLESQSMYAEHTLSPIALQDDNELVICARALGPQLRDGKPRARWRTRLVSAQGLRRWRTTLIGRMPSWYGMSAPVGPWRPVRLRRRDGVQVGQSWLGARVVDGRGVLDLRVDLHGLTEAVADLDADLAAPQTVEVVVGAERHRLPVDGGQVRGEIVLDSVSLWWPHTHGEQPLYDVSVVVAGVALPLGRVGFRAVEADRSDGGFSLVVNGQPVFCRGVCWVPPDVMSLASDRPQIEAELRRLRDAGLNTVRVTGTMTWESAAFWDCCDELGIMVWQDCMLATLDPPDDDTFLAGLETEVRQQIGRLAGRPALLVVSGGSETEQQPTMVGLASGERRIAAIEDLLPGVVAAVVPGVPYVSSTPTGGPLPTHVGSGVAHYFGVGAYLRPVTDVRLARVRFAAECLAFSTPPERPAVEQWFGSASPAGHDPQWKRAVPRDNATSWDFEDVTLHYVREVFGVDPVRARYSDPEYALDLCRATVAHLMSEVMTAWRRPASGCGGALVLASRDLAPGAGWGLLDAAGRPKAPWYALRAVLAPVAVLVTDEGLDGLAVHALNDGPEPLHGRLRVAVLDPRGNTALDAEVAVTLDPHAGRTWSLDSLLGVFRDVNHAYRFGPEQYEGLVARLVPDDGRDPVEHVHVLSAWDGHRDVDLGMRAVAEPAADGGWDLAVSADRLARWVCLEVPGFDVADSWFHLLPGTQRRVRLDCGTGSARAQGPRLPRGTVRALNGRSAVPIEVVGG